MAVVASDDVAALLASHPLFRHLVEHERHDLARNCTKKEFRAGEMVFVKGDPGGAFHVVLTGRVLIVNYSINGQPVIYDVLCRGDNFGEVPAIDGKARTAHATTLDDTELLIIGRSVFLELITQNSRFALSLLDGLSRRLRFARALLDDLIWFDLPSRLAKRLLALVEKQEAFGQPSNAVRVCHLSQNTLAGMIGASRQTVNKLLRDWEHQGIVELHREEIIVSNIGYLRNIADGGLS
jgi:CRP/FNR family cyclic AMP-dependent transcriptional regulator